jgi:hypothetical protein
MGEAHRLRSTSVTTGLTETEQLYFPYGAQRTVEAVAADYRYTGQRWEEDIGLYDYKAQLVGVCQRQTPKLIGKANQPMTPNWAAFCSRTRSCRSRGTRRR